MADQTKLSLQYRLMIYATVAIIHFHSKNINIIRGMSVYMFREMNPALVDRTLCEIKEQFNYELSSEQVNRAIHAYLIGEERPLSPTHKTPYMVGR